MTSDVNIYRAADDVLSSRRLIDFLNESNRIEGIPVGNIFERQIQAAEEFLKLKQLTVADVENIARVFQPDARLRKKPGMNVRVGDHFPIPGSPEVVEHLRIIIDEANQDRGGDEEMAYIVHHSYEKLHPFTDGNGRSGRLIWLWMMGGRAPLGFLHTWYYQSLRFHT